MKVTARAQRSGDWWAVEVPEVPGLFTQARRLDQVEAMVKDAAQLLGVGEVEVEIDAHLTGTIDREIRDVKETAAAANRAQQEASRKSRAAATALRQSGLTVRDIAVVLGVSPQRVSQVLSSTSRTVASARHVSEAGAARSPVATVAESSGRSAPESSSRATAASRRGSGRASRG
jgi:predicted RNase H-like HicB family nuclease